MKLHLLQAGIDRFLTEQILSDAIHWYLPHSMVDHFFQFWHPISSQELSTVYDECLQNQISVRWWKRENYRPKEIMLQLIETDAELALIAFKDLANESASLDGRISRFQFYCEDLLDMLRKKNKKFNETYHHQDASMLSLYLAGMYPDKYVLYPGLNVFQKFCAFIESPDVPKVDDLVRFEKMANTVFKFMEKNEKLSLVMDRRQDHKIKSIPLQMAFEFISNSGGNPGLTV